LGQGPGVLAASTASTASSAGVGGRDRRKAGSKMVNIRIKFKAKIAPLFYCLLRVKVEKSKKMF
jgi:hypothetical protein